MTLCPNCATNRYDTIRPHPLKPLKKYPTKWKPILSLPLTTNSLRVISATLSQATKFSMGYRAASGGGRAFIVVVAYSWHSAEQWM